MRRGDMGSSLINTLILASLVATLAFTAVAISFHQLNMTQRLNNSQEARDLAEAAVTQFLDKLLHHNESYPGPSDPKSITVQFAQSEADDRGFLSFDPTAAAAQGVGWSLQNLNCPNSNTGFGGRVVPAQSIHLLAQGRAKGITRTLEVILHVPTYTFAMASEGLIDSPGPLIVGSLADPADLLPDLVTNFSKLLPGHIASNAVGSQAIGLDVANAGTGINVTGNVRAQGQIVDGASVQVKGQKMPNASKVDIPELPLDAFDPDNFGIPNEVMYDPSAPPEDLSAKGLIKHDGSMTIKTLKLPPDDGSGAIVYVKGNLTVLDGIEGQGAVVCTGNMTVNGTSSVTSPQIAALVAQGDLKLQGDGRSSSFFKGLLYSGGSAWIQDTTVMGSMVSKGTGTNTMHVENVNFLQDPTKIDFKFTMPFSTGGAAGSGPVLGPKPPPGSGNYSLQDFYNPVTDHFDKTVTAAHIGFWIGPPNGGHWGTLAEAALVMQTGVPPYSSVPESDLDAMLSNYGVPFTAADSYQTKAELYLSFMRDLVCGNGPKSLNTSLAKIDTWYQAHHDPNLQTGQFSFGPNRFLPLKDKLKVSLWKEL